VEALQTREALVAERLGQPLGHEQVIPGDMKKVPKFLTMRHQLDTIVGEPCQHPDRIAAPWAMGGLSEVDGLDRIGISIETGAVGVFFQNEEA
jgi:hypothetical protein